MVRPTDPLAGSAWSTPGTVAGFVQSPPNADLAAFAADELRQGRGSRALDVGCGAGRNALPLAQLGWRIIGLDLSWPMLLAAGQRVRDSQLVDRLAVALAPMDALPIRSASCDLVIRTASGILRGPQWSFGRQCKRRRAWRGSAQDSSCSPSRATRSRPAPNPSRESRSSSLNSLANHSAFSPGSSSSRNCVWVVSCPNHLYRSANTTCYSGELCLPERRSSTKRLFGVPGS